MKKRTGEPWMDPADYGRSLRGFDINLLVRNIDASVRFATRVLLAEVVYQDEDFAVLRHRHFQWMLHADHTYENHAMSRVIEGQEVRGRGVEFRFHDVDPDQAESRARQYGYEILDVAKDKPHGLRETYVVGPDGYVWVLDNPLQST